MCGTEYDFYICTDCGKLVERTEDKPIALGLCKDCLRRHSSASGYESVKRYRARLDNEFSEWLAKVRKVPKDYPALTEAQWLAACKHFNGCARCGDKSIDARGFFISASLGGRYCDWNIIPVCERCATRWNLSKSAFKYLDLSSRSSKRPEIRTQLTEIRKYLGGILDDATRSASTTEKSGTCNNSTDC